MGEVLGEETRRERSNAEPLCHVPCAVPTSLALFRARTGGVDSLARPPLDLIPRSPGGPLAGSALYTTSLSALLLLLCPVPSDGPPAEGAERAEEKIDLRSRENIGVVVEREALSSSKYFFRAPAPRRRGCGRENSRIRVTRLFIFCSASSFEVARWWGRRSSLEHHYN